MQFLQFKDIPINSYFIYNDRTYKKLSYEIAKDIFNYDLKIFNLYDDIMIPEDPEFKLNY